MVSFNDFPNKHLIPSAISETVGNQLHIKESNFSLARKSKNSQTVACLVAQSTNGEIHNI